MNILNNMSIKLKLFLIFIIPTLALTYQIISAVVEKNTIVNEEHILGISVELTTKISSLVHETQKERGFTAGFLSSKGIKFTDELKSQKSSTDTKLQELHQFMTSHDLDELPSLFIKGLQASVLKLSELNSIRSQVTTLAIEKKDAIKFYTSTNAMFLDSISDLARFSHDAEILKGLNSYANFLYSKERAGIERAVGAGAFSQDRISAKERIKFNNLIAEQNSFIKSFNILETTEKKEFYNSTMQGSIIDDVDKMRDILLNAKNIGGFNVDANYWFETMTKKLSTLREIEIYISNKLIPATNRMKDSVKILKALNSLLHETQKERGATAGFLASKGTKFKDTLLNQAKITDIKVSTLKKILKSVDITKYTPAFKSYIKKTLVNISSLNKVREEIKVQKTSLKDAIKFYTDTNSDMLNITASLIHSAEGIQFVKCINTYYSFLMSKERAGIERAILASSFSQNSFADGMKVKFVQIVTQQNAYLNTFLVNASEETTIFYNKKIDNKTFREVQRMRDIALNSFSIGGFKVDASIWFDAITKKINLLKKVDDKLSTDLIKHIKEIEEHESSELIMLIILGFIIITIAAIMSYIISMMITKSLKTILLTAQDLSSGDGDLTKRLKITSNDEIGDVAKEINNFMKPYQTENG